MLEITGVGSMPSNVRQSLNLEDKKYIRDLMLALEPFRAIRSTMPLQHVYAFLQVCLEEGLGVVDYAVQAEVSQSVMSRHLLDIGERNRYKEPGFGLVTSEPDPMEIRKYQVFLTDKGKAVAQKVVRPLKK